MATRRYEISLPVLKDISPVRAECSIYYVNINEIPNHFTGSLL